MMMFAETYVAAPVHLLEAVQVSFKSSQVLLLHIAEQVLDGQCGHLDGRGGVHVCCPSLRPLQTGDTMPQHLHGHMTSGMQQQTCFHHSALVTFVFMNLSLL